MRLGRASQELQTPTRSRWPEETRTHSHLGALTQPTPGVRNPGSCGEAEGVCGKLGTGWRRRRARRAASVASRARAGPRAGAGTPRPLRPPPPPGRLPAAAPGCGPGGAAAPWPQGRGRPGLSGRWGAAPPSQRGPRRPAAQPWGPRAPPRLAALALPASRWGRPWGGAGLGRPQGCRGTPHRLQGLRPRSPSEVLTIS